MPVVLVGSIANKQLNFIAVACISMVSYKPPKIAITPGNHHHANKDIKENEVFSICFPSTEHMKITDLWGMVTRGKEDKSKFLIPFMESQIMHL